MNNEDFQKLITNLSLTVIQPTKVEYERLGNPPEKANIQINWKMIYPKDESFKVENNVLQLCQVYWLNNIFRQVLVILIRVLFMYLI